MKVRIKDTIHEYVSADELTLKEAMRIKIATRTDDTPGLNLLDLYRGTETGDPFAIAAMVWISRIRDGEKGLKFDDVDFRFGDFEVLPDAAPELDASDEAVEVDPTTPDPA